MTVEDVLTEATVLYLQQGKGHELEFISKSESSSLGWYFWLHGVDGVYEIESFTFDTIRGKPSLCWKSTP